jgi:hypothetical protein
MASPRGFIRWAWLPILLVLILLAPRLLFALQPARPLEIVVIDKTVPFDNFLEHRGLFGLIAQLKIRHADGRRYEMANDYIGAKPGQPAGEPPRETIDFDLSLAESADLIYLIDSYGVYSGDLLSADERRAALERSEKIYGGLTLEEAIDLDRAVAAGVPLVAEFNAMASPTGVEARKKFERTTGVGWTRWIGRYFPELSDVNEVPQWTRDLCRREQNREWSYEGAGYVILQDDEFCEVLVAGEDTERIGLLIDVEDEDAPEMRSVTSGTPYGFWFEWVTVSSEAKTLASYQWKLTESGRQKLARHQLPERFPAVVRRPASAGGAPVWYFAGDFGDSTAGGEAVPLVGFLTARRWLERPRRVHDPRAFYYRVYAPLMSAILDSVESH